MAVTTRYLDYLASEIDRYGIQAVETELAAILEDARRTAVSPVVLSVLADPRAPGAARARAFGIVATRLSPHAHERDPQPRMSTSASASV